MRVVFVKLGGVRSRQLAGIPGKFNGGNLHA